MAGTREVPCNLCGSRDCTVLFTAKDRLHGLEGRFTYVQCNQCSLVYMNPQVIPEDAGQLYPRDYAPHAGTSNKRRSTVRSMRSKIGGVPILGSCLRMILNVKIARHIWRMLDQDSRVLDVGCGAGAFLNEVRRAKACEVQGIDISEAAVRRAKESYNLDIFHGNITDAPYPPNHFDLITAWWYLEHVPNLNAVVSKMTELLRDDGHCVIGVPNHHSLQARRFKDKWYHLDCPRHLCIFTPGAIRRLLAAHGLSVTKIVYDKTPWGLLGSLQYAIYGDNVNPKHRNRIRQSLVLWIILLPWTIVMSLLVKSDIMVVYARKGTSATDGL